MRSGVSSLSFDNRHLEKVVEKKNRPDRRDRAAAETRRHDRGSRLDELNKSLVDASFGRLEECGGGESSRGAVTADGGEGGGPRGGGARARGDHGDAEASRQAQAGRDGRPISGSYRPGCGPGVGHADGAVEVTDFVLHERVEGQEEKHEEAIARNESRIAVLQGYDRTLSKYESLELKLKGLVHGGVLVNNSENENVAA